MSYTDEMDLLQRLLMIVAVVTAIRSVTVLACIVDAKELANKRDNKDFHDDEEISLVDIYDHKSKLENICNQIDMQTYAGSSSTQPHSSTCH